MEAIEIRNLNKSFDEFSLKDIKFDVPKGSITGLVGANGAGKTTIINLITNILKPDSGCIYINGEKLDRRKVQVLKEIYYIMGEDMLIDDFIPNDYDKMMEKIYHNWDTKVFLNYLNLFELPLNNKIEDYSKGMKVKLNFAIALAISPKILILDEATSGLDPLMRDDILNILLEYVENQENTILFSSHIVSDLEKIADKIVFIDKGRIILEVDKFKLQEEYGILKLTEDEFKKIDLSYTIAFRVLEEEIEMLVSNKIYMKEKYPNLIIKKHNIEDIIILMGKGDQNEGINNKRYFNI